MKKYKVEYTIDSELGYIKEGSDFVDVDSIEDAKSLVQRMRPMPFEWSLFVDRIFEVITFPDGTEDYCLVWSI